MIKSFTINNGADDSFILEMSNPWDSRVIIEKVDGLAPTKGTINTNALATSDGSVFNSARQDQRNIVFSFGLLEDLNDGLIETTRQKIYRMFPEKKKITIEVETDNRYAMTEGYVESNEPDIFSEAEKQQVSIICPNAFWTAPSTTYSLNGTQDMFEFPFSNESLTEDMINFGEITDSTGVSFKYEGDVESGIVIRMKSIGRCENPTVYNILTHEEMSFNTDILGKIVGDDKNYIDYGDQLICSTVDGDPYVTYIRDNVEYNAIGMLPKISDWIKVYPGYNAFGYSAEEGEGNIQITIETRILYGGI